VEAGLALEAALARVAEKTRGALGEEIGKALYEASLGKSRRDALRDMAQRTGVSDLIGFIAAILQADQTGVSIGQVLRVQSDSMRVRRRQRAEERAMAAPLKMIFPLIFCILPATMVVILGPAIIAIWQNILGSR